MELYSDLVRDALGDAARIAFEELMVTRSYEFQSEFARKHDAAGRAAGRAEGESSSLLAVLEARGFAVSDDERRRILACADPDVLLRWARRAVSVSSVAELFQD